MTLFSEFVVSFQRALKALQLYTPRHPSHLQSVAALQDVFQRFLHGRAMVQIAARNGRLFVDRQLEDADNLQVRAFARNLEERSIHAVVMYPGATARELGVLLELLCAKPGALAALGGAKQRLETQGVTHIRILATRLDEVSDAGEVSAALFEALARSVASGQAAAGPGAGGPGRPGGPGGHGGYGGPGPGAAGGPVRVPGAGGAPGPDLDRVVGQMQAFLVSRAAGRLVPADLGGLGDYLASLGLDGQGSQPTTQGVITQAIHALDGEQQLSLFLGAGSLRQGPLRNLIGRLATSLAAPSLAGSLASGEISFQEVADASQQLQDILPSGKTWLGQIREAMVKGGMSQGQVKDLVDLLTWESRPEEERIQALLEGQRIFELPAAKVVAFLRELLEAGRIAEFLRLARHYATGLVVPAVARRRAVAESFEQIADWVDIPGMSPAVSAEVMEILAHACAREKAPEVHQWLARGLEHLLWWHLESGEGVKTCEVITWLRSEVAEQGAQGAWKEHATADLLRRLAAPARLEGLFAQLFSPDRQLRLTAVAQIHPFLALLGPVAAEPLVEQLSKEPDRVRRGRLMEALRACGNGAEAPLMGSLKSKKWFVVRNALNVLAEVGTADRVGELEPFLAFGDARVRLTAVRTLGRIGGRAAENALTRLLQGQEADLQYEALFILDELKARHSVPAMLDYLKAGRGRNRPDQDKVREKTLEVIGHLGSASAVPVLVDLLTWHKGFFRATREPLPARIAALRALKGLACAEGEDAIARALASEPPGPELDALRSALTEAEAGEPAPPK